MLWYLVHTKPRQEKCALENLQRQGFQCYLPTLLSEKLRQGVLTVVDEPLFPRYLFIRLGQGDSAPSWAPIRSTKGVSRLVSFGVEPAKVADSLVEALRAQEESVQAEPERLFKPGDHVTRPWRAGQDGHDIARPLAVEHRGSGGIAGHSWQQPCCAVELSQR